MTNAWIVLPLVWAGVLALSGIAKLRTPDDTLAALQAMPIPGVFKTRWLALALPYVELSIAAGLIFARGWLFTIVSAMALLLAAAYFGLIALVLRRGEATRCACFGALAGGEVTWVTLARNALLLAGAIGTLVGALAGWSVAATVPTLPVKDWCWLAALLWAGLLVAAIGVRQEVVGSYERKPIPDTYLADRTGLVSIRAMAAAQARVLVFLSPGCDPCQVVAAQFPQWSQELWPISLHAVTADWGAAATFKGLESVMLVADPEDSTANAFEITGTPSAVVLGTDGLVAGGPVTGSGEIIDLVNELVDQIRGS